MMVFFDKIKNFIWKYSWYISDLMFFSFFSDSWYLILFFVLTLIAAVFHAQMFFNCSNSLRWLSNWYISFVPSLNWDSVSQMEIMKQCIPQNNLFQQMTMLQCWLDRLILILIQSHLKRYGYTFNIAKFYPLLLLPYLDSDVFSALHNKHLSMKIYNINPYFKTD